MACTIKSLSSHLFRWFSIGLSAVSVWKASGANVPRALVLLELSTQKSESYTIECPKKSRRDGTASGWHFLPSLELHCSANFGEFTLPLQFTQIFSTLFSYLSMRIASTLTFRIASHLISADAMQIFMFNVHSSTEWTDAIFIVFACTGECVSPEKSQKRMDFHKIIIRLHATKIPMTS